MAESVESSDAMVAANNELAKKFGPTVRVYSYGSGVERDYVVELMEGGKMMLPSAVKNHPYRQPSGSEDIDFNWLDLMDFAGDIDVDEEVFNDDTAEAIEDDVFDILFEYGLLVTSTDNRNFFGHYLPWYVDGHKVKNYTEEWKLIQPWGSNLTYSLEHINDSHPYAALKNMAPCGECEANAEFEDYSEHKITMKCSSCGSEATFTKETDYAKLRRNPSGSNMPKIVGAMLGGAMLAAWFDHRAK